MYRKVSKILALIVLVINSSLSGQHLGFDRGYNVARKMFTEVNLSGGGLTVYTILFEHYAPIVWLSIFYLIGKSIKKEFLSQIICFSTLGWIVYLYWQIYFIKTNLFTPSISFNDLIRETIHLDWISFSLALILLIFQIISVFQLYFNWKRNNAEVK